jgi:uncharacterized DUF497 family protein
MIMVDTVQKNNYYIIINGLFFEWDLEKEALNIAKHKISFGEATHAFFDLNAQVYFDPEHSESEERYIILGYTITQGLLVVCHCYRNDDEIVRIFSARTATATEAAQYRRGRN